MAYVQVLPAHPHALAPEGVVIEEPLLQVVVQVAAKAVTGLSRRDLFIESSFRVVDPLVRALTSAQLFWEQDHPEL
jgi:hypothetical protein